MKFAIFLALAASLSLAFLTGCGGGGAPKSAVVEVKGYVCNGCKAQFYTTDGVNAQICPQCKAGEIKEVRTYTCPADQQKTIAQKSREGTMCKQCKALVTVSTYPTEEDLKAWGATKKSKAEVGAN